MIKQLLVVFRVLSLLFLASGMKERAELVGDSIEIESSVGKGTTIYVRVPASFNEQRTR
jgi:signal transduction histidine kinase